jgi:hypothetical protein
MSRTVRCVKPRPATAPRGGTRRRSCRVRQTGGETGGFATRSTLEQMHLWDLRTDPGQTDSRGSSLTADWGRNRGVVLHIQVERAMSEVTS